MTDCSVGPPVLATGEGGEGESDDRGKWWKGENKEKKLKKTYPMTIGALAGDTKGLAGSMLAHTARP
jgi:hypothetical protein